MSGTQPGSQAVERPRGLYDRLPDEQARLKRLEDILTSCVQSQGYRSVETPVLEHTELFVRKSGGERISQLYQFKYRSRSLALRPEHTASVMRLFIERMQTDPLPIHLSYCGPVFRYESPQAGRSRQFTEFGCELIGATSPLADAEIINLAVECAHRAGVERPLLVLGHIGSVLEYLNALKLDHRTQDWLIWSMERIRRGEPDAMRIPDYLLTDAVEGTNGALSTLNDEAILALLAQSGPDLPTGGRTPEDIAEGIALRRRRKVDRSVLESALSLVQQLIESAGPPMQALPALRRLAEQHDLDLKPIEELAWISSTLANLWGDQLEIKIDFGLGRGLRYYTGMIFEVYPDSDEGLQLVGGGRYDDLATHLGARQSTPACGFSLGMERLLATGNLPTPSPAPSILILGDQSQQTLETAGKLRDLGWQTELEVRNRSAGAARRWAARRGFTALATLDGNELTVTRLSDGHVMTTSEPPGPWREDQ